jgi:hypothetical protein
VKVLRLFAVLLGLSLMIGEAIRSWGQDRPAPAWLDDQLMGALLITSAWLLRKPTPARRALFTGAWGVGVGALYLSFFGKLLEPTGDYSSNIPGGMLTLLIGLAFATAIAGFVASLVIPFDSAK